MFCILTDYTYINIFNYQMFWISIDYLGLRFSKSAYSKVKHVNEPSNPSMLYIQLSNILHFNYLYKSKVFKINIR